MASLPFLFDITIIFFMRLLAVCLRFASLIISRSGTIYKYFFNKTPQESRFQIFHRETFYLKNSKIGRQREPRRIYKSLIEHK